MTVTVQPESQSPARFGRASRLLQDSFERIRGFVGALIALVILVIFLSLTQPFFLTKSNLLNILAGNSTLFLVSLGLTFVLLTAGFDLSVGAILASAGYSLFIFLELGLPGWLAILASLLVGVLLGGAVNGLLIGKVKLNFLVVTLGTSSLFTGLLNVLTGGKTNSIRVPKDSLVYFVGNGTILSIQVPIIICIVALLVAGYVLRMTSFGRNIYAVGGNREAARLAGINVSAVLVSAYAVAGLFAALGGLVMASRLSAAAPTAGSTMALTAGAAVLLGGTSFFGGIGGVTGTVIGVLLIGSLQNGLGLMGVSAYWQGVLTGAVLIVAVFIDRLQYKGTAGAG